MYAICDYTSNEIVDIILVLGKCHNNYRQAVILYRNRFPHRRHPNHCMISRLVVSTTTSMSKKDKDIVLTYQKRMINN